MQPNERRLVIVVALALPLALALAACNDGPQAGADTAAGGTAEESLAVQVDVTDHPIDDVLLNPDEYVGEEVTVTSDVEAILGTHAFTLAAPGGPFVVVSAMGIGDSSVIERGAPVRVQGTVRDGFSIGAFEDEFAVDLGDEALAIFEDRTYVVAERVTEPEGSKGG